MRRGAMGRLRVSGVILACFVGAITGCLKKADPEVHLIPDGLVGPVVIVYGVSDGAELLRDQRGALIYRIPPSGRLLLQSAPPVGFSRKEYFVQVPGGGQRLLPHQASPNEFQVFGKVHGTAGASGLGQRVVLFTAYLVGVPNQMSDWAVMRDRAVDRAVAENRSPEAGGK